jgi:hypothetical protein
LFNITADLSAVTSVDEFLALSRLLVEVEPPDGSSAHSHQLLFQASIVGNDVIVIRVVAVALQKESSSFHFVCFEKKI